MGYFDSEGLQSSAKIAEESEDILMSWRSLSPFWKGLRPEANNESHTKPILNQHLLYPFGESAPMQQLSIASSA
jgi:hypothetical protein